MSLQSHAGALYMKKLERTGGQTAYSRHGSISSKALQTSAVAVEREVLVEMSSADTSGKACSRHNL